MDNSSFALEMLKELTHNARRWFIIAIVELVIIIATTGIFVWYINQPIEEIETTTVDSGENGIATYLENSESGDINYGENNKD